MPYEVRISLLYLAIGIGWIIVTDYMVEFLFAPYPKAMTLVQTYKGIGYVFVTAVLLYVLLRRELCRRAAVERQIRDSEEKFRDLFMNNPYPMWVSDPATLRFLEVNHAAIKHYGYTRDEFMAMTLKDIRPPEDVPRFMDVAEQLNGGALFRHHGEWRHKKKDDTVVDVELDVHSLEYQGRRAALVVVQDITEHKRLQAELVEKEKLRLALQQEQELRYLRNQFMRTVSHEFRTPLASIALSVDMLESYSERMPAVSKQKRFAQIREQVKRLTEMLNEISIILKTEAPDAQFQPAALDLVKLCRMLVEAAQMSAQQTHTVVFTHDQPIIDIQGNEQLLRYAISNLLDNAVKYSPQGGHVRLDVRQNERMVVLRVEDEGIGIPQENIRHLFEPFYRAENVGDIGGTGLGLAIVKQAIEMHGGTIEVESVIGKGTAVTVRLPLA